MNTLILTEISAQNLLYGFLIGKGSAKNSGEFDNALLIILNLLIKENIYVKKLINKNSHFHIFPSDDMDGKKKRH